MEKVNLIKEIMDSNLKDETKLELVKTVMISSEGTPVQPIQVPYVIKEVYRETPKPWWNEITCGDSSKKTNSQELWDDSGWWQQHLKDAQGDVEPIIHPNITWGVNTAVNC